MITCDYCGAIYTEEEYEKLELTGHNIVWNFDYRRCKQCRVEITPISLSEIAKKG
jgi:uncharacterized protein with PIN domain